MMKLLTLFLLIAPFLADAQTDSLSAVKEIITFQKELNDEYKDRAKSPLSPEDFKKFKNHDFYPTNLSYRVTATLRIMADSPFLPMKTTSSKLKNHRIYAFAEFTLKGQAYSIPVYQSKDLLTSKEYVDYLFFPFTDLTNENETYGGGRYIDLRIPKSGNEIVIDFNKAYNPFCAYSEGYSCPLVPSENNFAIAIPAGIRGPHK